MQSKASDQWAYFQAKKLRAEQCENTIVILRGILPGAPMNEDDLRRTAASLQSEMHKLTSHLGKVDRAPSATGEVVKSLARHLATVDTLLSATTTRPDGVHVPVFLPPWDVPQVMELPIADKQIVDTIRGIESNASESDLERQAGEISQEEIDRAIATANENSAAFSRVSDPMALGRQTLAEVCNLLSREVAAFERAARQAPDEVVAIEPTGALGAIHDLGSQFSIGVDVSGLNFNSNRYQREARDNQVLAQILEIQVRRDSFLSERHRLRSRQFFYGMLAPRPE